jgi:hypothetical protein
MSQTKTTTVIIAIPGGQETRELSLAAAHAAIARGEIEPHHWAWSPGHNDWKQVSELPELQFIPIAPPRTIPALDRKKAAASLVVQEAPGFGPFKIFVLGLALAVLGLAGANYALVDQPLRMNLTQTAFPAVPVHGHLGAFLQPSTMVIHLLPDKTVNADNLADFLVALARSTPPAPFGQEPFATVGLTTAWTSQYLIPGSDWLMLGHMDKSTLEEKQAFILSHFASTSGEPLVEEKKNEDPSSLAQIRAKAWQSLAAGLVHS